MSRGQLRIELYNHFSRVRKGLCQQLCRQIDRVDERAIMVALRTNRPVPLRKVSPSSYRTIPAITGSRHRRKLVERHHGNAATR
jgi:hypothetical protein